MTILIDVVLASTFFWGCIGFFTYEVIRIARNRRAQQPLFTIQDVFFIAIITPLAGVLAYWFSDGVDKAAYMSGLAFISIIENFSSSSNGKKLKQEKVKQDGVQFDDIGGVAVKIGKLENALSRYFRCRHD